MLSLRISPPTRDVNQVDKSPMWNCLQTLSRLPILFFPKVQVRTHVWRKLFPSANSIFKSQKRSRNKAFGVVKLIFDMVFWFFVSSCIVMAMTKLPPEKAVTVSSTDVGQNEVWNWLKMEFATQLAAQRQFFTCAWYSIVLILGWSECDNRLSRTFPTDIYIIDGDENTRVFRSFLCRPIGVYIYQ